jgi:hypothetical protein
MTRTIDGDELPEGDCWCYEVLIEKDEVDLGTLSFHTHWVGYADPERRIEIREPTIISRNDLLKHKSPHTGKPIEYVETPLELARLWIVGGHAAVDYDLAQAEIPHHLKAKPVTSSTGNGPFDELTVPIKTATVRAPSKKLRMQILERDQYRCKICGQRPSDDPNITLHVYHIRPWANHGATVPSNLITICHTCHAGLDPHYKAKLATLLERPRRKNA